MKRILSFILALLLMLSLAGCSSSGGTVQEPASVSTGGSDNVSTQPDEPAPGDAAPGETAQSESDDAVISETVLVDEAGVKITAKELENNLFGAAIKLLIENGSGKDLTFQSRNTSVNGYMIETMMSVDVVDGKKANDTLTFLRSELDACGIGTIADMEFSFHIFTTSDWDTYLDTDSIQLKTSAADSYPYTFDDSGHVVYDENGLKIVVKGLSEDTSIFGPGIIVYLENTGNENITVQTRDVSINGFMVDTLFSCDVLIGKHAVDSITFLSSALEDNEITEIKDVELSFHIFNAESWNTIADTETVTISF